MELSEQLLAVKKCCTIRALCGLALLSMNIGLSANAMIVEMGGLPIEHVWDFIGRKINQRNTKCQNIDELGSAILQEW
jgi:hypothetical protein